jgi:hypothetical protein
MKLTIHDGKLYLNNVRFSLAEELNGRGNLPVGRHQVETRYSHHHSCILPYVESVGWLGFTTDCAIVLGEVRAGGGIIPCRNTVERLVGRVEIQTDTGGTAVMEIK